MTAADDDLYAEPENELRPEPEFQPILQPARKRRRGMWMVLGLVVVAGAAGAGGWVYLNGWPMGGSDSEVPLIRAETGPIKVQPENPGGMEVPDQDKLVYDRMEGSDERETVERLLPPPETPMPKPQPAPLTPAPEGQAATAAPPSAPPLPAPPSAATTVPASPSADAAPPAAQAPEAAPTVQEVLGAMRPPPPPAADQPPPGPTTAAPPAVAPAPPPKAAAPQVAAVPPPTAAGGYKVQLAAVRSREDVDKEWGRIKRQNSDLLGNLQLSVMRVDLGPGKGVFYRLRAGPLTDDAAAKSLCAKLSDRKVGCLVVRPEG